MRLKNRSHSISLLASQPALLISILWLLAGVAAAQVDRAVLEGTVADSTGAAIAGANVKIVALFLTDRDGK